MKPNMNIDSVSTKMFHWHAEDKVFTQEISSLGKADLFSRLYSDACDVGFELVSHKTGKKVVMYFSSRETNDGDILSWCFKPTDNHRFSVIVFND